MIKAAWSLTRLDLRLHRLPMTWVIFALYGFLFASVLTERSEHHNVVNYTEIAFPILMVMVSLLFFQRDLNGEEMEVTATFPFSIQLSIIRKWILGMGIFTAMFFGWIAVYLTQHQVILARMYIWEPAPILRQTTAIALFLQHLPSYLALSTLTIAGLIMFKKSYAGMAMGFGLWMLDLFSAGRLLGKYTFTVDYLVTIAQFRWNQIGLTLIACILISVAALLAGIRSRWISNEEE